MDRTIGIDIGGSVIKIVYLGKLCEKLPKYIVCEYEPDIFDQRHYLLRIPNQHFDKLLEFLQEAWLPNVKESVTLRVTGGGAHKLQDQISQKLGLPYQKIDELETVVRGLDYVLSYVKNEIFTHSWRDKKEYQVNLDLSSIYPALLVNVGSGVSILRIEGPNKFVRISGTSLGGGTFMGLAKLMTGIDNFEEIIQIAKSGDNKRADLLVRDIYGKDYAEMGLPGYVIASNFGKVATDPDANVDRADIIRSLIYMISDNIAQIAILNTQTKPVNHIFFSGSFLELGPTLWKKLSYGIEFWSGAKQEAKFLRHSSYLGAVGTLLS